MPLDIYIYLKSLTMKVLTLLLFFVFVVDLRSCFVAGRTIESEVSQGQNPCSEIYVGRVPHPENCRKYIMCFFGVQFERDCLRGFGFLPELQRCVPMRRCFKNATESTSAEPDVTTTTTEEIKTTLAPEQETTLENVETTTVEENQETTSVTEESGSAEN
ncbi:hypothetical protein ACFFRR_000693 [Megaselia abdita]